MQEPTFRPSFLFKTQRSCDMGVLDTFRLDGCRALVTGSSMGIGFAIAKALASAGAHVVLNARSAERLAHAQAALAALGLSVSAERFDVTDAEAVKESVERIESGGPLDVLVPRAGIMDEDLGRAALAALALDPADCRAHALGFSWAACARQFLANLEPLASGRSVLTEWQQNGHGAVTQLT